MSIQAHLRRIAHFWDRSSLGETSPSVADGAYLRQQPDEEEDEEEDEGNGKEDGDDDDESDDGYSE